MKYNRHYSVTPSWTFVRDCQPAIPSTTSLPVNQSNESAAKQTRRPVRSFVIREGRLTRGQERALLELWPRFGVDFDRQQPLDFNALFGRAAPVACEIGFGDGGALREMAAARPDWNFLGIEVHRPGVGNLMLRLEEAGLTNVRIIRDDAVEVLEHGIALGSLSRLHLYFPDPWPKKRHHKRRILSAHFAALAALRLTPGEGIFHFATDWEEYAEDALETLAGCDLLENVRVDGGYSDRPEWRPETRFERRGLNLGHRVRDILMRRPAPVA